MVFVKEWEENLNVCPRCDHHDRIGAKQRFAQLFDGGLHEILPAPAAPEDPLKFRDTKKYVDRIKAARSEEHTSELQSLMRISYAVFCLKKKKHTENSKYNIIKKLIDCRYYNTMTTQNDGL